MQQKKDLNNIVKVLEIKDYNNKTFNQYKVIKQFGFYCLTTNIY